VSDVLSLVLLLLLGGLTGVVLLRVKIKEFSRSVVELGMGDEMS
jgi:hypothetical protein